MAEGGGVPVPARVRAEPWLVAALGLAVALNVWLWTRSVNGYYLDEWVYTHGARWMWNHLPLGPVEGIVGWDRGPQRLYALLLAPLYASLSNPDAFAAGHALNAVLLGSIVVPAWLIARPLAVRRSHALLAAALATVSPFLVVGSNLLTESLAMPLSLWALWGIVRALERPTLRRQALALALIALATAARSQLAVLFGVYVATVVAVEGVAWRRAGPGRPSLGAALADAARRQPLVALVGLLALAYAGLSLLGVSLGSSAYDRTLRSGQHSPARSAETASLGLAVLTVAGAGVVTSLGLAALGLAAVGRAGPRARAAGIAGCAATAGLVAAVAVFVVPYTMLEERYVSYAWLPIGVAAGLSPGLGRRIAWPFAGVATVLTAVVVAAPLRYVTVIYGFFAEPAEAWFIRNVVTRAEKAWSLLPLGRPPSFTDGIVLAGLCGAAFLLLRSRRAAAYAIALLVAGLAWQAVAANYAFDKLLGSPSGLAADPYYGLPVRDDWVDRVLAGRRGSAFLVPPPLVPAAAEGDQRGETAQMFNDRLDGVVQVRLTAPPSPAAFPPGSSAAAIAPLLAGGARWLGPVPSWLALDPNDSRVQVAGRPVAAAPAWGMAVVRMARPPRFLWSLRGLRPDLSLPPRRLATGWVRGARAAGTRIELEGPAPGTRPGGVLLLAGGRILARALLKPGASATVRLPAAVVEVARRDGSATFALRAAGGGPGPDGRPVAVYVRRVLLGG